MLLYLSMIETEAGRSEFERIYLRYEDIVFRKILHVIRNREDTEDVMQETWIRVAKNIEVLRDKDDAVVFSYIMKIATNQAMTFFRKQNTSEISLTEEELDEAASDDSLFTACDRVGIDEIAACFAELPKIYRDVLSLYFFHEHNTDEIAELLNMNVSTVSSRLVRGRKKLILLLERRGIHD